MRLSRKKAIELCIELWTWCANTGKIKWDWPEWEKYGHIAASCWFCEYAEQQSNRYGKRRCFYCPYWKIFGRCEVDGSYYDRWRDAQTPKTRKKYAKLFLEQIKQCR